MKQTISIFKKIQSTSSKNEKLMLIKQNKDNSFFVECLKFLLDSQITTGIAKKKYDSLKIGSLTKWEHDEDLHDFLKLLNYIKEHNTGKDNDICIAKSWCYQLDEEIQEFTKGMITKTIKLGCDYKTANKAIPNLIKTWEVQQAYPISEKNYPKQGEIIFLTQKLNGNNCGYVDGKLISRQGKQFNGLNHIINAIESLPFKDMFFNGELIRKNDDNLSDDENFQIGTGIINSDDEDKTSIKFVIYEMFPKEEFYQGKSKLGYKLRREKYLNPLEKEIQNSGIKDLEVVKLVYQGTDITKIETELKIADEKGWEGLMCNKNTLWENKRNNGILKIKSFKHCDILCTRIEEGDGKNQNSLGAIICDYKGFELGVGSGFNDKQRKDIWENPDSIIGKVVQIKYKTETKNKDGGLSVQFPTFVCIRENGKEISYES